MRKAKATPSDEPDKNVRRSNAPSAPRSRRPRSRATERAIERLERGRQAVGGAGSCSSRFGGGERSRRRRRRGCERAVLRRGTLRARPARPRAGVGRAGRARRPQRRGQDDAASTRCSGRLPLAGGHALDRPGRARRRRSTRPRAASTAPRALLDAFVERRGLPRAGGPLAAGQVRPRAPTHVARPAAHALPRRAHPREPRAADGVGRELPRARRADQPPRPARDRAARDGARRATTARCCSSPTTASCSKPSRIDRTIELSAAASGARS